MTKDNTPELSAIQLPLFGNDDRPAPIRAAEAYEFPLQRYEPSDKIPEMVYSIQDWIKGVAQTDDPRGFWDNLKRRLKRANIELSPSCLQLPYTATNGKKYQMDFATNEVLYQITQRMDANTGIRDAILAFLSKAGAHVDWEMANPEAAAELHASRADRKRQRELDKLNRAGYSERPEVRLLQARHDGSRALQQLKDRIAEVCTEPPRYGQIINAEYLGLFGHVASELTIILKTKNIRDGLTELELGYLRIAEISLREVLANKRLNNQQIITTATLICRQLGENLASISEMIGTPLLKGGQHDDV